MCLKKLYVKRTSEITNYFKIPLLVQKILSYKEVHLKCLILHIDEDYSLVHTVKINRSTVWSPQLKERVLRKVVELAGVGLVKTTATSAIIAG